MAAVQMVSESKMHSVVVIGGTGFIKKLGGAPATVPTRFGDVPVLLSSIGEFPNQTVIYAINRNGNGRPVLPSMRNHRAHTEVAKEVNAKAILAVASVGIINADRYRRGALILPSDAITINLNRAEHVTLFEESGDRVVHLDCSELFDRKLKAILLEAGSELDFHIKDSATVAQSLSPHFETEADVQALKTFNADLVGMSGVIEAILASESEIPYALVAVATNYAAGVNGTKTSHDSISDVMLERADAVINLFKKAIEMLAGDTNAEEEN